MGAETSTRRSLHRNLLVVMVLPLLVLIAPARSEAAFPGANGRVAYDSNQGGTDTEIMSALIDGSGSTQLTNNTVDDKQPAWSPDGKKIAWAHFNSTSGFFEIWTMNADGTNQAPLVSLSRNTTDPSWSKDGSRIAFVYQFSSTDDDIYRADTSALNTNLTPIIQSTANERDPAYAPSGNTIAYSLDSPPEINTIPDSGGPPTTVYSDGFTATKPNWSADGAKIAFQWGAPANHDVIVVNSNGSGRTVVVNAPADERDPAWSPQGNMIAYDRVGSDVELYTVNPDGSGNTPLENRPSTNDLNPDWQPVVSAQVRPKGASPMLVSLVPAFNQCTSGNATHDPPDNFASCAPPQQTSTDLTVGEPLVNGKAANFIGSLKVKALSGDGQLTFSLIDVRCARTIPGSCAGGPLSDYTGNLSMLYHARLTDRSNPAGTAGTVLDFTLNISLGCIATTDPSVGSSCSGTTTLNTLVPGVVVSGRRAIWQFLGFEVRDPAGKDFAVPGTFYP